MLKLNKKNKITEKGNLSKYKTNASCIWVSLQVNSQAEKQKYLGHFPLE